MIPDPWPARQFGQRRPPAPGGRGGPGEHQTEGAAAGAGLPGRAGPGALGVRGPGRFGGRGPSAAHALSLRQRQHRARSCGRRSGRHAEREPCRRQVGVQHVAKRREAGPCAHRRDADGLLLGRHAAGRRGTVSFTQGACPTGQRHAQARTVRMLRITVTRPGVTTVRVWRERDAAAPAPISPQFVLILLADR